MQTVALAQTGRTTTRLGFGCSSLMGSMGRAESLRTLEWAYEAGVRHFDVAPMYGYGAAESCLGEFLASHPGEVTVTTKFGIPPANHPGLIALARRLARPLIQVVPGLKERAQRAAAAVAAAPQARNLTPESARASLESSLRELRVERIDVFLLHDAQPEEVRGDDLLEMLLAAQAQGKIGAFGIGTDRDHVAAIQTQSPAYAPVVQCEWSVFDPVSEDTAFHIHHRSLAQHRRRLEQYLKTSPDVSARWSAAIGADLREPAQISELMMRAALGTNPQGIVLFSSKDRRHIQDNAALAEPSAMDAAAVKFYELVQQEASQVPPERGR